MKRTRRHLRAGQAIRRGSGLVHVHGTTGDVNALDYGGGVVFEGPHGVEWEFWGPEDEDGTYEIYRADVPDDVFDYHNWVNISAVASTVGESPSVLRRDGRSSDPMRRVRVLEDIVSHYGAHELDQDPLFSFSWGDWILKRVDFATWAFWMWGLASGDQDPLLLSRRGALG